MKIKLLPFGALISVLSLSLSLSAQDIETSCGTPSPTEEEFDAMPHVGNNKALIAVLKKHGLNLPHDYFEKLDNNGLYRGRGLSLDEVRNPNANPPGGRKNKQDNSKDQSTQEKSSASNFSLTTYLPVKFWVYINNAGDSAFTKSEVNDLFFGMQEIYRNNGVPIEFFMKCQVAWIVSEDFYHINDDDNYNNMWDTHKDNNAINVHLVGTAPSAGVARRPGIFQYVAKNGVSINSLITTFAHETGHNLGLLHTHNGRCSGDNHTCTNCRQEPVSRFMNQNCLTGYNQRKCEINGDALCDTAADPKLSTTAVDTNCSIIRPNLISQTDNWGATWQPSTRNIMSYSERLCRQFFSYGQIGVMLNTLENDFNFKSTIPNHVISGPSQMCINQNYTFTVPAQSGTDYYHWQIPNGWIISGQGNRTVSITVSNYFNDSKIYVTASCGQSIAPKNIEVLNPYYIDITGPDEIPADGFCRSFSATQLPNGSYYNWSISGNTSSAINICSGQGTQSVMISASWYAGPFTLNVSVNSCGGQATASKNVGIGAGGGPVSIEENTPLEEVKITEINSFRVIQEIQCLETETELNNIIKNLPTGYYLVRYQKNGKYKSQKIIKP